MVIDQFLSQAEAEEQRAKLERRELRKEKCGSWEAAWSEEKGSVFKYQVRCGCWRDYECMECTVLRIKEHKEYLLEGFMQSDVRCFEASREEINEYLRGVSKERFRRYPQHNDRDIAFCMVDEEHQEGEPVTQNNLPYFNWFAIVNTPRDRRTSGRMGATEEKEKDWDTLIHVKRLIINAPWSEKKECAELAIEDTSELDPRDAEGLEEALERRNEAYRERLEERGYSVLYTDCRRKRVKITRINWQRNKQNRAGSGNKAAKTVQNEPVLA
jgi:hypothetical protein